MKWAIFFGSVFCSIFFLAGLLTAPMLFKVDAVEIARQLAYIHSYNDTNNSFGHYVCVNFSRDLAKNIRSRGYDACVVRGFLNGSRHAWVAVRVNETEDWYFIEATTGETIDPKELGDLYTWCEKWECL